MTRGLLVAAALIAVAVAGLPAGDPVAAFALADHADRIAPDDPMAPIRIDAARELSRVRPWQPGFTEARRRLAAIHAARLRAARGD